MAVTLRTAKVGDEYALADLQDIANGGQLSATRWSDRQRSWTEMGAQEILSGHTELSLANTIVADQGGQVVGMLNHARSGGGQRGGGGNDADRPFLDLREALGECIYLRAMAVLPEARGRGVAAGLLDLAQSVSRMEQLGLGVIVHESNARLLARYERRGFRRIGVETVRDHVSYPLGSSLIALRREVT